MSELFNEIKESLTMQQVAEHFGYKVNSSGFIHSPFNTDKTASLKIYPHSYYDFSSNSGGDLIKFSADVLGVNNWQACQYLIEAFSLPYSLSGNTDNREQIRRREQERQRQQEKEEKFKEAWLSEVDSLKTWECLYKRAIEEKAFSPLSEMQEFVVSELQKTSHKLDVLCGLIGDRADQEKILRESGWTL